RPKPNIDTGGEFVRAVGEAGFPSPRVPILARLRPVGRFLEFATSVNIRVTSGKLQGLHFAEWAKDEEKQNESGVEERGTTWHCGDSVGRDGKANSWEVEPTVLSHLDSPDSQFGARYFARGSTSVGFGPEWTVEAHESGAERGSWFVEEGDGAAEVK